MGNCIISRTSPPVELVFDCKKFVTGADINTSRAWYQIEQSNGDVNSLEFDYANNILRMNRYTSSQGGKTVGSSKGNPYKWYYTHNDSKGLAVGDNNNILTQTLEPGVYIIKGTVSIPNYDNRCIIALTPNIGQCVFDDRSGWFSADYTTFFYTTTTKQVYLSVGSAKACTASVGMAAIRVAYV